MKQYILVGLVVLVLVLAIVQAVQISNLKEKINEKLNRNNTIKTSGTIDKSNWTEDEIMNYEMHGIIPTDK